MTTSAKSHMLKGVRAKIARAQHHFDDINATLRTFFTAEDYTQDIAGHEYQTNGQELIIRAKEPKPLPPSLPLLIGDCIHNLRSALDHLVFQLAILNGTSKGAETKTSFPICLSAAEFKNAIRRKVAPFISLAALAAIEKTQPYKTVDPGANVPLGEHAVLWVLSQLDNIDKHRIILVTEPQIGAEGFTVTGPSGEFYETPIDNPKWKPLKPGTEIIRFKVGSAFHRPGKVQVNLNFGTMVYFVETGLFCDGRAIQDTLYSCLLTVTEVVRDFEKEFF